MPHISEPDMKVTQLDYSAILAANSVKANANQMKLAVDVQEQSNRNQKWSLDSTQRAIALDKEARSTQHWLDFASNVIDITMQTVDAVKTQKDAEDGEKASSSLGDMAGNLTSNVNSDLMNNKASYFDADNNIVQPEQWNTWKNADAETIKSMGLGRETEKEALKQLDKMYDAAWQDIYGQLFQTESQSRINISAERLDKAMDYDAMTGSYDTGEAIIRGRTWLTPSQIEEDILNYRNDVDAKRNAGIVTSIASGAGGTPAALEYIDGIKGKSPEDIESLKALARSIGDTADSDAATKMADYVDSKLSSGMPASILMEEIQPQLDALDPERREKVESAINPIIGEHARKNIGFPSSVSSATTPELVALREKLSVEGPMYYAGISDYLETDKALVDKELQARDKAQESIDSDNLKIAKESMEYAYNQYMSGNYTGNQAIDFINEYAKIAGTDEDNNAAMEFIEKVKTTLPKDKQLLVDTYIDDFKTSYKEYLKNAGDKDPNPEVALAVRDAQGRILDLFRYMSGNEISDKLIADTMQDIQDAYMGEMLDSLAKLDENTGDQTLSRDGRFGINNKYLKSGETLLEQANGLVWRDADNTIQFSNEFAADYYVETAKLIAQDGEAIGTFGTPTDISPRLNSEGKMTAIPVVTFSSGVQLTVHEGNIVRIGSDGSFTKLMEVREDSPLEDLPTTEEELLSMTPDVKGFDKQSWGEFIGNTTGTLQMKNYSAEINAEIQRLIKEQNNGR